MSRSTVSNHDVEQQMLQLPGLTRFLIQFVDQGVRDISIYVGEMG